MRAALWVTVLGVVACSSGGAADAGFDAGRMPHCYDIFGDRQAQVCLRWSCDRADLAEGVWSGDAGACEAGQLDLPGHDDALKLLNLYRFLADLPAVEASPMRSAGAQQCALMMHAAGRLEPMPQPSFPCWSQSGAEAATNSIQALAPSVAAIDAYVTGAGDEAALRHRRWVLGNTLGPVGVGGTSAASCLWVSGGTSSAGRRFVAWPGAGPVPLAALERTRVADTGWSVHTFTSANALTGGTVAVLDDGVDAPVDVTELELNQGSASALSFKPRGWTVQAGHEYVVNVVAPAIQANPIVYTVQVVACP